MKKEDFFHFLTTYNHTKEIPININCQISYGTDYTPNTSHERLENQNRYTRLNPRSYLETIKKLSLEIKTKL